MKVDSTEPHIELSGTARIDSDLDCIGNPQLTDVSNVRNYHDIQASLAIINGYSQALKSSFQELKDQYGDLLETKDGESDTASGDRLMSLEADCRFCLSRLCGSIEQLKQRLAEGGVLCDSTQD